MHWFRCQAHWGSPHGSRHRRWGGRTPPEGGNRDQAVQTVRGINARRDGARAPCRPPSVHRQASASGLPAWEDSREISFDQGRPNRHRGQDEGGCEVTRAAGEMSLGSGGVVRRGGVSSIQARKASGTRDPRKGRGRAGDIPPGLTIKPREKGRAGSGIGMRRREETGQKKREI